MRIQLVIRGFGLTATSLGLSQIAKLVLMTKLHNDRNLWKALSMKLS